MLVLELWVRARVRVKVRVRVETTRVRNACVYEKVRHTKMSGSPSAVAWELRGRSISRNLVI